MTRFTLTCLTLAVVALLVSPLPALDAKPAASDAKPTADKGPAEAAQAVAATVECPLLKGSFKDVLAKAGEVVGVRVDVDWDEVLATGVKASESVALAAGKRTGAQLFDLIIGQVAKTGKPLAWYADGRTIQITTQIRVLYRSRVPSLGTAIGRSAGAAPAAAGSGATAKGEGKFDFTDMPCGDVFNFLRDLTNLNFHINWKALQQVNVNKDTTVNIQVGNLSVARAMDLLCEELSGDRTKMERVYWVVDEGVVEISTGTALNQKTKTRIYDIADILATVPQFEGPRIDMNNSGVNTTGTNSGSGTNTGLFKPDNQQNKTTDTPAADKQAVRDTIIETIKSTIGEDMWLPNGAGSVKILGNKLIISQTLLGFKLLEQAGKK